MKKEILKDKLNEFLKELELEELSNKTIQTYRNAINKFIDYYDDSKELTKETIIDFKKTLVSEYAIKSRNQYITVLNKYLKYIDYPDLRVKLFKEQEKSSLEDIIEPQEHKRLLRWAKQLNMMEAYMIILVFANSGARIGELKHFTYENLDSNYIKGSFNKGKERTLIMTNELRRELKKYCRINRITSGYIFRSPDKRYKKNPNKRINDSTVWRWLKKIARKAKINPNKIHPHAWRHLFAKQCRESGIGLDELADILGHKNLNTTAIYTKTSMKEKRLKMEQIWRNK